MNITELRPVVRRMPPPAGRFAVVRDVLIVAVCLALVANFLVQLWHAREPSPSDRGARPVAAVTRTP
jgi:hypothetical protein